MVAPRLIVAAGSGRCQFEVLVIASGQVALMVKRRDLMHTMDEVFALPDADLVAIVRNMSSESALTATLAVGEGEERASFNTAPDAVAVLFRHSGRLGCTRLPG